MRLVLPYPPGGNVDGAARVISERLQAEFGQPFVVENKPGAGGLIAGEYVAKAAADGYTFFMGANGPILFSPLIFKRDVYHWKKDFIPVGSVSFTPLVLQVHPSTPYKTSPTSSTRQEARQRADHGLAGRRHHQPPGERVSAARERRQVGHGALQGQRPGDDRPARRTGAVQFRPALGVAAFHPARPYASRWP